MNASIFNIQKFCLHDGPGIRTTVFFKGCNLRCAWCANPESQCAGVQLTLDRNKCSSCASCVQHCPSGARIIENGCIKVNETLCSGCGRCIELCPNRAIGREGRLVSACEVFDEVMKDEPFYRRSGGGVTFSGGEVLIQQEFATELARMLHTRGVTVAIETAANVPAERFREFLKEIDFVYVDLKHYDSAEHRRGTGSGNGQIIENIRALRESGKEFMVRIPVIPGYNDAPRDAQGFAALLTSLGIDRVQLLPFHQLGETKYHLLGREYAYAGKAQLHREELQEYSMIFKQYGVQAQIQ